MSLPSMQEKKAGPNLATTVAVAFTDTANGGTLGVDGSGTGKYDLEDFMPNQPIMIQADQDCYVLINGATALNDAAANKNTVLLAAGTILTLPFLVRRISVIRVSVSGTLKITAAAAYGVVA